MATQQTNISLGYGIRRTPSLGDDGELSEAMNLIPRGGELVNIQQPVAVSGVTLDMYDTLLAVHETAGVKRYIVKNTNTTSATLSGNVFRLPPAITSVRAMGNCLVTTTSSGLLYYLWDNDHYKEMGDSIAELQMYFDLDGTLEPGIGVNSVKFVAAQSNPMTYAKYKKASGTTLGFGQTLKDDTTKQNITLTKGDFIRIGNYGADKIWLYWDKKKFGKDYKLAALKPGETKTIEVLHNMNELYIRAYNGGYRGGNFSVVFWKGTNAANTDVVVEQSVDNINALLGCANSWLNKAMKDEHRFVMPFFVRAAIELYDGTYIHHTMPAYMVPNTGSVPFVVVDEAIDKDKRYYPTLYGMKCDLKYRIKKGVVDSLKAWEDLIRGVSISVTDPIYRYDEGAEVKEDRNITPLEFMTIEQVDTLSRSTMSVIMSTDTSEGLDLQLGEHCLNWGLFKFYGGTGDNQTIWDKTIARVYLPEKKDEEVEKDFLSKSVFHEIANLKLSELEALFDESATSETMAHVTLDLSDVDLSTISTKKVITDGFRSHDKVNPSNVFVYNGRVAIANVETKFWNGYEAGSCQGLIETDLPAYGNTAVVNMVLNGTKVKVVCENTRIPIEGLNWLFYPNENAESIELYQVGPTQNTKVTISMKKHDLLCGSYWKGEWDELKKETFTGTIPTANNATYRYENSVYTSNVNDPFVFPLEGRTTVGSGAVLGLSTSAKALSQGQFGQFPLLAFCTDGIWALSVGDSGNYVAKQPISRDVVNNADSITQIDSAVVFSCEQGLKMISGSDIQVLSERIDGLNLLESNFAEIPPTLKWPESVQFTTALAGAKILYDYPHGHLHVFPDKSNSYGYVLDLASGEWSKQMIAYPVKTIVQGYPYSSLQSGMAVYEYRRTTTATATSTARQNGYILTRSYSFGNPLSKKALYDIRSIGQRTSTDTKFSIVVYISDDNVNWTKLTSLKMKSAKYYRFLIKTYMTDLETLSGISIQFQERYTNKMR